mmetsp:Transcript_30684/g.76781  ORF Transcript_30684/g.76781 Transcript_30684/m.76781 type:complete len:364 (-) Transcript_30684:316-1407(-)
MLDKIAESRSALSPPEPPGAAGESSRFATPGSAVEPFTPGPEQGGPSGAPMFSEAVGVTLRPHPPPQHPANIHFPDDPGSEPGRVAASPLGLRSSVLTPSMMPTICPSPDLPGGGGDAVEASPGVPGVLAGGETPIPQMRARPTAAAAAAPPAILSAMRPVWAAAGSPGADSPGGSEASFVPSPLAGSPLRPVPEGEADGSQSARGDAVAGAAAAAVADGLRRSESLPTGFFARSRGGRARGGRAPSAATLAAADDGSDVGLPDKKAPSMSMLAKLGLVGGARGGARGSRSASRRKSKTLEKILLNGDMASGSEASTPGTGARPRLRSTFHFGSDPATPRSEAGASSLPPGSPASAASPSLGR